MAAMAAVKLEHPSQVHHEAMIMQQMRKFWTEDHLCDVVLKSQDGTEHRAHAALLSAVSMFFKNLLGGSFLEADQVQRGLPVEMSASKAAVSALLDFIYSGQPEVQMDTGLELLRLAEAYDLPQLAKAIEAGFCASLDSIAALQILEESHGLHTLKSACEQKVAEDFETCSRHPDFGKLSASQLARILKRDDLGVSREEAVLEGIFHWLNISKDRKAFLGILLQHVDFQSISIDNLLRIGRFTLSGPSGDDLRREVDEALLARERKRRQSPHHFQPKRRCFQHWSPDLGATTEALGREVLPTPCDSLFWHQGVIYGTDLKSGGILSWNPSEPVPRIRRVVGEGSGMMGINDLGTNCDLSISPTGEIFVADFQHQRLVSFQNGFGNLVLSDLVAKTLFCSPNGVLYVVMENALQKLVGSTLQTVVDFQSLPADLQCSAIGIFVTKEEMIYLSDDLKSRVLYFNPAESFNPVVVGQIPDEHEVKLWSLCVTEGGTIYVGEQSERKVLAFRPGDSTFTEVLQCPDPLLPMAVLVHERSLYVSMADPSRSGGGVYEYVLPPDFRLAARMN